MCTNAARRPINLLIIVTVTTFCTTPLIAQKQAAYDELKSAFSFAEEGLSCGQEAMRFIKLARSEDNIEDMQHYARRAMSETDDAESNASDAEDDALFLKLKMASADWKTVKVISMMQLQR